MHPSLLLIIETFGITNMQILEVFKVVSTIDWSKAFLHQIANEKTKLLTDM